MTHPSRLIAWAFVVVIAMAPDAATGMQLTDPRRPPPSDVALAEAMETTRLMYEEELANLISPIAHCRLASTMLERSRERELNSSLRYALLTQAREHAEAGGDEELAYATVEDFSLWFLVDFGETRASFLERFAERASKPEEHIAVTCRAIGSALTSLHSSDPASAEHLLKFAERCAKKTKDKAFTCHLDQLQEYALELRRQKETYLEALAAIDDDSATSSHYTAAGRYRAFLEDRWESALPWLIRSDDLELAEAARQELRQSDVPGDALELADRWWAIGEREASGCRFSIWEHAHDLYLPLIPDLDERERRRVLKRLDSFAPEPKRLHSKAKMDDTLWTIGTWDGNEWKQTPLVEDDVRRKGRGLELVNARHEYPFSKIFYNGRLFDREFVLWFEVKGPIKEFGLSGTDGRDAHAYGTPDPNERDWRGVTIFRQYDSLRMWMDGQPQAVTLYNLESTVSGLLTLAVVAGDRIEIRNLHYAGGRRFAD